MENLQILMINIRDGGTENTHGFNFHVLQFGMKSMMDSLRIEIANRNLDIRVSTVSPGI